MHFTTLELSSASARCIRGFIEDTRETYGASSLRARYVGKTDDRGQRTKVLVLFVRTGKENIVDRMINFFDKSAQNRLAVEEINKRVPGILQKTSNAQEGHTHLPEMMTVDEAAKKMEERDTRRLVTMLEIASTALNEKENGKASSRSIVLKRGGEGMLFLASQAYYEHDMRLVRQHLGVGTHITEADFESGFTWFARFALLLTQLSSIGTESLSAVQRSVIDEGLKFCSLWLSASTRLKGDKEAGHPSGFHSLQGWAIGEILKIAAPMFGDQFPEQQLPNSFYGLTDLKPSILR
ncbi:hypothetical protein KTQ42_10350|uniref:hypothetical protein n=1 Tax=Noviherbaspirillum sp. L7-7A TaxID=2850560 RepID=UPI001C2B801D|nr:hypothetical protein [Noviherbaspirillum sp. L7-7A]MBV0879701.1 hypothetical protein [Noviherbaspirillum sp. L7-7A]